MSSVPPTKRRKVSANSSSQLPVITKFFKPTKKDKSVNTSQDQEETIVVEDSSQSTSDPNNREGSPELFSSPPLSVDDMATALTTPTPVAVEQPTPSPDSSRTQSLTPLSDDSSELNVPAWSGSPLSELCFGPSASPVLPPLISSATHSVLFRPRLRPGSLPQPYPDKFRDVWDQDHVRMPCSSKSQYPVDGEGLVCRWDLIKKAFGSKIENSHELEKALLSYNSHYAKRWSFKGLHIYFEEICSEEENSAFFDVLLPKIVSLALSLPQLVTHAVPLLKKQQNYAITLSQQQVACLLANAFLCTFPRRNSTHHTSEYSKYPFINFNHLFTTNSGKTISQERVNKLRCLFHYFTRVTSKMPQGTLTFQRQVLSESPQWEKSTARLPKLHVTSEGTIEDNGHGMLQVDFANKYLGGGVLNHGCVQEEIRFLVCPELLASLVFTEELDSNECLLMTGCERFSNYRGYARSFEWSGSHRDETTRDNWGRIQTKIVAIDALKFHSLGAQFKPGSIRRELDKAYCGFLDNEYPSVCGRSMAIATGNWGCGAFGGDARLKGVLQLMAAAEANRDVVYFTFGNCRLQHDIASLHAALTENKVTVGQIWSALVNYSSYRTRRDKPSLYSFLHTTLGALHTPADTDTATVEYSLQ